MRLDLPNTDGGQSRLGATPSLTSDGARSPHPVAGRALGVHEPPLRDPQGRKLTLGCFLPSPSRIFLMHKLSFSNLGGFPFSQQLNDEKMVHLPHS